MEKEEIQVIEANTPMLSPIEMELFCRNLLASMKKYYKDPKNMEAFKKWKEEREKETK